MTKQSAALLSIFSNTALVILKIMAGVAMGSVAVISEAVHSGIDLVASFVAWISIRKGAAPADSDHPYGHGKFENVSGFFEAILIFVAAGIIITEALRKLVHPGEMEQLGAGIIVMGISALVNTVVSLNLFRIAKKTKSIALEADAMHLSVDVFTSLGVTIGLIAIHYTNLHILDPIIAIAVAGMIIHAAWDLTRRSLGDLLDKSLPHEELTLIGDILSHHPEVTSFHKLRTRKSGATIEIDLHVRVDDDTHIVSAHDLCHRIEDDLCRHFPGAHVTMHVEPERCRRPMPTAEATA